MRKVLSEWLAEEGGGVTGAYYYLQEPVVLNRAVRRVLECFREPHGTVRLWERVYNVPHLNSGICKRLFEPSKARKVVYDCKRHCLLKLKSLEYCPILCDYSKSLDEPCQSIVSFSEAF